MTQQERDAIKETMEDFFGSDYENFLSNDGALKTEIGVGGWGEFVRTNLVETGVVSEESYDENPFEIFNMCEAALNEYERNTSDEEESDDEKYTVQDLNDKDRVSPVIDSFDTLEEAEAFAREWSADYGSCTIHKDGCEVMHIDVNAEGEDAD